MKNKVLLVYAGEKANLPRLPTNLVVLAAYIREHGFNPYIFDTRVSEYHEIPQMDDVMAIGISAMTVGIGEALETAKRLQRLYPKAPIIWGGPHVTFFPHQSLKSRYVDAVVMREGEKGFLKVLKAIEKGEEFEKIVEEDSFLDMEKLPFPAYDLLDLTKYADLKDGFNYESSRGCPENCSFCYTHQFHKRRWRAKSVGKVLKEVGKIIDKYEIKKLLFVEDNFFVNKKRALAIAQGFIDKGFNIEWEAMIRANYVAYYTTEEMALLKKSGWWNAAIGGESGSVRMLKLINKGITPAEIRKSVRNCLNAGVQPQVSFIMGIPGETEKDRQITMNFYDELKSMAGKGKEDDVEINAFFIYTPYPGTPLYAKALELGYKAPESLEEWADWKFSDIRNVPWMKHRLKRRLETISIIVRFWYYLDRIQHFSKEYQENKLKIGTTGKILMAVGIPLLKVSARLRWNLRFFAFPYEWDLFRWYRERSTEIN